MLVRKLCEFRPPTPSTTSQEKLAPDHLTNWKSKDADRPHHCGNREESTVKSHQEMLLVVTVKSIPTAQYEVEQFEKTFIISNFNGQTNQKFKL